MVFFSFRNLHQNDIGCLKNSIIFSINNGKLNVSYLDADLIVIEKGSFPYLPRLERLINEVIKQSIPFCDALHEFEISYGWRFETQIEKSLHNIFRRISWGRHGSILIFCYDGDINDDRLFHPGAIDLRVPFGSFFKNKDLLDKYKELQNKIFSYEDAIVSFSKTDGALIFDKNLDLIKAGVILKVDSSALGPGGARRKSAEAFIRDTNTIGVVISQDGTTTLLMPL